MACLLCYIKTAAAMVFLLANDLKDQTSVLHHVGVPHKALQSIMSKQSGPNNIPTNINVAHNQL